MTATQTQKQQYDNKDQVIDRSALPLFKMNDRYLMDLLNAISDLLKTVNCRNVFLFFSFPFFFCFVSITDLKNKIN